MEQGENYTKLKEKEIFALQSKKTDYTFATNGQSIHEEEEQTFGWRSTQKRKRKKPKEAKSQSQQPLLGPRRPRPSKFVARRLRWGYRGRTAVTVHCRTLPTLRSSLVPSSSKMRANLLRCLEWVRRIRAINVKVSKGTYFLSYLCICNLLQFVRKYRIAIS